MFRYFFIVVALTASLVGCAAQDEITLTAYKTLETSAITYDTVMTAASDMHSQGKLQDDDWEKLKDAALVYYDAYQVTVSGLLTYMRASIRACSFHPTDFLGTLFPSDIVVSFVHNMAPTRRCIT